MTARFTLLERELLRLSKLETVTPYVQARLRDAVDALRSLRAKTIEECAKVADREWDQKPIVAPLTNAAYDEAARTIAANIRALAALAPSHKDEPSHDR